MATDGITSLVVNGTTIEAIERGKAARSCFCIPASASIRRARARRDSAQGGRVIAPSHPGFGTSQLPKGMTTVDDVSYFYLDCSSSSTCATCWWSASASAAGSRPRSR
jgi:hypothetical protein